MGISQQPPNSSTKMASETATTPVAEETPKVVEETPKEDAPVAEKAEEVKNGDAPAKEETNGKEAEANGAEKNGEEKNGDSNGHSANGNGHAAEANGAEKNGEAENGDADKEATKRKAEESSTEEPIPVSAEKIAKLKEAETEAAKPAEETA